jgi:hypothetical protein
MVHGRADNPAKRDKILKEETLLLATQTENKLRVLQPIAEQFLIYPLEEE